MRMKSIPRTATVAWSPAERTTLHLAAGTDAEAFDASFSTSSVLELFDIEPGNPAIAPPVRSSVSAPARFHDLKWSKPFAAAPQGLLIGGLTDGSVCTWNAGTLLGTSSLGGNPLVCHTTQHCGPVVTLDCNPLNPHLLASGSSNAEIFIWDLNNPSKHLTPGTRSSPPEDVSCVAWNRQVPHILASCALTGRAAVWDLRAGKQALQVQDTSAHFKVIAWHPDNATQLATSSASDLHPVVQLWDLRNGLSPQKELLGHTKGILGMDWCAQDAGMLLTCGKDNRTLCWDPTAATAAEARIAELPPASKWVFDVRWCPRNPELIATASFDEHVTVSTLTSPAPPAGAPSASAFPGTEMSPSRGHAPKWLKRPVGAIFGLDGRLVTFNADSTVLRIRTANNLFPAAVQRAKLLDAAVTAGDTTALADYCVDKITQAGRTQHEVLRLVWTHLRASLQDDPRPHVLELIGLSVPPSAGPVSVPPEQLESSTIQQLNQEGIEAVCRLVLVGKFEQAVEVCIGGGNIADALMLAIAGGPELVQRTQQAYFASRRTPLAGLLGVVTGQNWAGVVQSAPVHRWRDSLAILLTYVRAPEFEGLCEQLGQQLAAAPRDAQSPHLVAAGICALLSGNIEFFLQVWSDILKRANVPDTAANLVEMATILKLSVEKKRQKTVLGEGLYARLVAEFGTQLAVAGHVALSLNFLDLVKVDNIPGLAELKRRLAASLSPDPAPVQFGGPVPNPRQAPEPPSLAHTADVTRANTDFHRPQVQQQSQPPQQPQQSQPPSRQAPRAGSAPAPVAVASVPAAAAASAAAPTSAASAAAAPVAPAPHMARPVTAQPTAAQPYAQPHQQPAYAAPKPPTYATQPVYVPSAGHAGPNIINTSAAAAAGNAGQPQRVTTGAWNDPPAIRAKKRAAVAAPVAISNPLAQQPQQPQQSLVPAAAPTQSQPYQQYNSQPQQSAQSVNSPQPPQQYAPEPVAAPLPPMPQHLQPIFDTLSRTVNNCLACNNPLYTRKIVDVQAKLNVLYEKLVNHQVDDEMVSGLQYMCAALHARDFTTVMQYHQSLVTSSNPAETGQYMIGIKVLVNIAKTLGTGPS